jgi:hypothetical protein
VVIFFRPLSILHDILVSFNNHLDKLQENLMKELKEVEKQVTEKSREVLVSLDEKQTKLTDYQKNIVS